MSDSKTNLATIVGDCTIITKKKDVSQYDTMAPSAFIEMLSLNLTSKIAKELFIEEHDASHHLSRMVSMKKILLKVSRESSVTEDHTMIRRA